MKLSLAIVPTENSQGSSSPALVTRERRLRFWFASQAGILLHLGASESPSAIDDRASIDRALDGVEVRLYSPPPLFR